MHTFYKNLTNVFLQYKMNKNSYFNNQLYDTEILKKADDILKEDIDEIKIMK